MNIKASEVCKIAKHTFGKYVLKIGFHFSALCYRVGTSWPPKVEQIKITY
jgi:hypothetical protein